MNKCIIILIISIQSFLTIYAQEKPEPEAFIILNSFSLEKSRNIDAAVVIKLEKGWHIYWRNPGDSGIPTSFEFILPENISASEIKWTVPEIFEFDGYASYGYEGLAVFPFSIYIPESFNHNEITIGIKLKSLICRDVCKPFNSRTSKNIRLDDTYIASKSESDLLYHIYKELPIQNDKLKLQVKIVLIMS